jgi:hypothetical protein
MAGPPDFADFVQLLSRALVHPGLQDQATHGAFRAALEDCWNSFRQVSAQLHAAGLRVVWAPGGGSTFVAACGPHPLIDVRDLIHDRAGAQTLGRLDELFRAAQMRAFFLLPGLAWEEFYQGVQAVFDGRADLHVEHRLLSRFAHRVMAQGLRLSVDTRRDIPQPVLEALDCMAVVLSGLERFGPGNRVSIAQALEIVTQFLVGELYNPAHARTFLASLDLASGALPAPVQRGVLSVCVKALAEEMRQPILQSCLSIVELAGGAENLGQRTDQGGVPLAGYYAVARAVARLTARDKDSESGIRPGGPWEEGPNLRSKAGMYFAPEPPAGPPPYGAVVREPTNPQGAFPPRAAVSQPAAQLRAPPGTGEGSGLSKNRVSGYQARKHPPLIPEPPEDGPAEVHLRPVRRTQESGLHRLQVIAPQEALPPATTSESVQFFGGSQGDLSDAGVAAQERAMLRGPRPLDPRIAQWLESYSQHGEQLMGRAQDLTDARKHVGAIKLLSHVAGWFLDQGRFAEALPLCRLLKGQQTQAATWPEAPKRALADALDLVFPPDGAGPLVLAAADANPADRGVLCELIACFELHAVPALLALMLARRLSGTLRREMTALIELCGADAGPLVVEEIERHGGRWSRIVGLVGLLGPLGYQPAQRPLFEILRHPQPKMREEAALALYKLLDEKASRYLMGVLDDADTAVCQRGVALLAAGGCREAGLLSLLQDLVGLDGADDAREEDLILTAILAIEDLGNLELQNGLDAERTLVDALRHALGGGYLGLSPGRGGRSIAVQAALCRTLGAIGGPRALPVLEQAARQGPPELRQAAARAVGRLKSP